MEILSFDQIDSTQKYLIEAIENKRITAPIAILAHEQTGGIGSRENSWSSSKGDFLFSFALPIASLPDDLPLASSSIYFAYIMKELLSYLDQNIWLKWPNDIYYIDYKVGGIVTKKIMDNLVCGIGINLKKNCEGFEALNIGLTPMNIAQKYLVEIDKKENWKQIFMKYKLEFNHNKEISTHFMGQTISLKDAVLCDDGSLVINEKRIYSLR